MKCLIERSSVLSISYRFLSFCVTKKRGSSANPVSNKKDLSEPSLSYSSSKGTLKCQCNRLLKFVSILILAKEIGSENRRADRYRKSCIKPLISGHKRGGLLEREREMYLNRKGGVGFFKITKFRRNFTM